MNSRLKVQLTAEERIEIFHDQFDDRMDASLTLAALVRSAGDYLGRIIGTERADIGMAAMLASLVGGEPKGWREELEDKASSGFSEWPLGNLLHDLAAYAHYGVVLDVEADESEEEIARRLKERVEHASRFLEESPLGLWLSNDDAPQLRQVVTLAYNRWALDSGDPIEPVALATFGGVSEAHIRNLMSGSGSRFSSKDGKIPAQQALAWLAERESFLESIWRKQRIPLTPTSSEPVNEPLFVPVARDGSVFHPGLRRASGFTVGPKGSEQQVGDYRQALSQLQKMPIPYWRRPNERGKWGTVRGTRWERYDWEVLAQAGQGQGAFLQDSNL
jgi:hypothetical protein